MANIENPYLVVSPNVHKAFPGQYEYLGMKPKDSKSQWDLCFTIKFGDGGEKQSFRPSENPSFHYADTKGFPNPADHGGKNRPGKTFEKYFIEDVTGKGETGEWHVLRRNGESVEDIENICRLLNKLVKEFKDFGDEFNKKDNEMNSVNLKEMKKTWVALLKSCTLDMEEPGEDEIEKFKSIEANKKTILEYPKKE